MSDANASTATTENPTSDFAMWRCPAQRRAFLHVIKKITRPPAGEQPETASLTPFTLARCEYGAGGLKPNLRD